MSRRDRIEESRAILTRTRVCHTFFLAAVAGQVTRRASTVCLHSESNTGAASICRPRRPELGAGGKPSTWLPPGKLADLLNNYTVHVLSPHAHVIFWCVPTIPYARCDVRTSAIFFHVPWCFPLLRCCFFCAILLYFP